MWDTNKQMARIKNETERWKSWKNGGGLTCEIAVYPPLATIEDFLWRISIAKIESSGPFSQFRNTHRSLVLLDGNGISCVFSDQTVKLIDSGGMIKFSGERSLYCEPIDGACIVLNVMNLGRNECNICVIENEPLPNTSEIETLEVVVNETVKVIKYRVSQALIQIQNPVQSMLNPTSQVETSGGAQSRIIELTFSQPLI
jgi:environmental stress-induced protein Ves